MMKRDLVLSLDKYMDQLDPYLSQINNISSVFRVHIEGYDLQ